jgi:hypothetical protein
VRGYQGRSKSGYDARQQSGGSPQILLDLENHLGKALAPYEEFALGGKTHYVSLGGMLHRKGPGSEEGEGYFCGYLDDEVWHHLKNYLKKGGA